MMVTCYITRVIFNLLLMAHLNSEYILFLSYKLNLVDDVISYEYLQLVQLKLSYVFKMLTSMKFKSTCW
jgi:hypothetical protein